MRKRLFNWLYHLEFFVAINTRLFFCKSYCTLHYIHSSLTFKSMKYPVEPTDKFGLDSSVLKCSSAEFRSVWSCRTRAEMVARAEAAISAVNGGTNKWGLGFSGTEMSSADRTSPLDWDAFGLLGKRVGDSTGGWEVLDAESVRGTGISRSKPKREESLPQDWKSAADISDVGQWWTVCWNLWCGWVSFVSS